MVLEKKGGIHIDWVISLAIFIVYILTMFTLIQPGQEEPYSKENLINIIEQNLEQKINYKINKTALYFTTLPIPGKVEVTAAFPFSGDKEDFAVYEEINTQNTPFSNVEGKITFCVSGGKTLFWILQSDKRYTGLGVGTCADPPIEITDITIGTTEVLEGIDETFLLADIICEETNYEDLKNTWKFPLNKDFRIYIIDSDTIPYDEADVRKVCNVAEPYEQADVFVKEKRAWKLDTNGTMTGVIVHMEVW